MQDERAYQEWRRRELDDWQRSPTEFLERRLLKVLRVHSSAVRAPNILLLETPDAPLRPLLELAAQQELQLGRQVFRIGCRGEHGPANVLAAITLQLLGELPKPAADRTIFSLDLLHLLHRELEERTPWPRVIVEGIESAADVHAIFGRTRDEIWQLPLQWLVTGNVEDAETYLQPPACSFFEAVLPNRAILDAVFGLQPHPYA